VSRAIAAIVLVLAAWLVAGCGGSAVSTTMPVPNVAETAVAETMAPGELSDSPVRPADPTGVTPHRGESRLYPIIAGGKYGFIDSQGNVVVEPCFAEAQQFSEGLAAVNAGTLDAAKWGYLDLTGELKIEPAFDAAGPFSEGLAPVCTGGLYGFVDRTGAWAIEPTYEYAHPFSGGRAAVRVTGPDERRPYGFVDSAGRMVIEPQFADVHSFSEGLAAVGWAKGPGSGRLDWGFIDADGRYVIGPGLRGASPFSDGLALVQSQRGLEYIDREGSTVIDIDEFSQDPYGSGDPDFSEGLAAVYVNGKWGYMDKTGAVVIEPRFFEALGFSEGRAVVAERLPGPSAPGGYGIIDRAGKYVLEPVCRHAEDYSGGLARVVLNGVDSYVDRTGAVVFPRTDSSSPGTTSTTVADPAVQQALDDLRAVAARAGFTVYYVGPTYRQAKLDRLQASLPDVPRSVTVAYRCRDYDNWLTLVIAQYDPAAGPTLSKPEAQWTMMRELTVDGNAAAIYASWTGYQYYVEQRGNTHIALGGSDMNGPLEEEELIEIAALLRPVLGPWRAAHTGCRGRPASQRLRCRSQERAQPVRPLHGLCDGTAAHTTVPKNQ